jgi:hypothetical protein
MKSIEILSIEILSIEILSIEIFRDLKHRDIKHRDLKHRDKNHRVSIEINFMDNLRCIYTSEFRARFRTKLAHFATNNFFFISKHASLVRNRPRNRANVNAPLLTDI